MHGMHKCPQHRTPVTRFIGACPAGVSFSGGVHSSQSSMAAAALLLVVLACIAVPQHAAAQTIGAQSVLQYHNNQSKAGYYVDANLTGERLPADACML